MVHVIFQVFEVCGKVHVEGPSLRKGRSSAGRWFKGFFRQILNDHCYHIHKIVVWSQAEHRHEFRFKVWNISNLHKILGHFSCVFLFPFGEILWNKSSGDSKGQSGRLILRKNLQQCFTSWRSLRRFWMRFRRVDPAFVGNKSHVFFEKKHF